MEQRYGPTSGTVSGYFGLVLCALVIGLVVTGDLTAGAVRVIAAAAGAAVLIWAYMLRPRIILEADGATLVLRNPLSSWRIPVASVRVVAVKAVTTVGTDDARYDAVAVGYPLRTLVRDSRQGRPRMDEPRVDDGSRAEGRHDEQSVMTEMVLAAAERARQVGAVAGPVQRIYAVAELALVGIATLTFVATYLV